MRIRTALQAAGAVLVLAGAGFTAGQFITNDAQSADTSQTCNSSISEAELATRIVGNNNSYRKDNPAEYALVRAYLDGGARPDPTNMTHMGKHLVYEKDVCVGIALPPTTSTTTTTTTVPTTTSTTTTTTTVPTGNASLAVSTSGSDSTCVRGDLTKPCATFMGAYQKAQCGDVVEIRAGSYSTQTVREVTALNSCTSRVLFMPAAGASVTVANVTLGSCFACGAQDGPQHVTFQGFAFTNLFGIDCDCRDILLDSLDGGGVEIDGHPVGITVQNSDLGPCYSDSAPQCARNMILDNGTDITFQDNSIHDFHITPGSGSHWECMFNTGGTNVTIQRNHFWNCDTYAIYTTEANVPNPGSFYINWKIQNNWFGRTCCFTTAPRNSAIFLGSQGGDVLVRFNSFASGQTVVNESGNSSPGSRIIGNIFGAGSCIGNNAAPYAYNLTLGTPCASTDRQISSLPYANGSDGASGDYHLNGSGIWDGFVPLTTADGSLANDYDAQPRSAPRDAGSDEH